MSTAMCWLVPAMTASHPSTKKVRHTKDDALDKREFELLLEGCYRLEDYWQLQSQFVVLVAGRLGMRAGEIAHMTEDWIDWRRNFICIPRHRPCTDGRGGDICGYCKRKAQQKVDHNPGLTLDDALERAWEPKTAAAAREIPFDASPRAEIVVERFFERYDGWPHSRQSVNRRVNRAATAADELSPDDIYPHALRATAASYFAGQGLDIWALQSMLGWAQVSTAECYVTSSGERTAQAIRDSMA
jgi:integrase